MRLSQAQLNAYNGALHGFQESAEEYFRALMGEFRADNPGASVSTCREFCIVAMEEALGIYAPAAQELAAQLFDEVCEAEGIDARAELPDELYDRDMLVDAACYNAGKLVEDAVAGWVAFVDAESRLANYYVRRSAYETMKQSCKDGNVQWARVPTGRETCGYCFMLASRGFDYVSEDTAKAGSHVGCDCIVVPGKLGRTEIEGYHPEELYERWKECEDAAESKNYRDVIEEVKTRDWDWLWTGEEPEVDYSDKPRESLEEHEKRGIDALQRNGFRVKTIAEDPKAAANFDIEIDGVAWEMKNVTNSASSTNNQMARGKKKWHKLGLSEKPRIVITTAGCTDSFESVVDSVKSKAGYGEVIVVSEDGSQIARIKK